MKNILFIFLLTTLSYGQTTAIKYDELFYGFKAKHFKLTIKTQLNEDVLSKIASDLGDDNSEMESDLNSDEGSEGETDINDDSILDIAKYDVRLKVYLSKKVSFTSRVVVSGLDTKGYFYSGGLTIQF